MLNLKNHKMTKTILMLLAAGMLPAVLLMGCGVADGQQGGKTPENAAIEENAETAQEQPAANAKDLVITVSELSQTPTYYPVEANGTDMEVIALVATDGTVRTAFNTCQVCYSSGRGYYKADGGELVCQNCGNRFTGDAVGVLSGGCNPVPITEKERSENNGVITISGALLSEASVIFQNWK